MSTFDSFIPYLITVRCFLLIFVAELQLRYVLVHVNTEKDVLGALAAYVNLIWHQQSGILWLKGVKYASG